MDERLASIIIPSKGRPYQLRDCVDGILATTAGYQIEIIIVVDDLEGYADLLKDYPVKLIHQDEPGAIRGWNKGLKESQGEIVVMGADDLVFNPGWYEAMLAGFERGRFVGLTYFTDQRGTWATHYAMTRDYLIEHNGGVLICPAYHHQYIDFEASARAMKAGEYIPVSPIIEHRHPAYGTAVWDQTYEQGCKKWAEADGIIHDRRVEAGYPDDFEAVITA